MSKVIALDIETTGLDPWRDEILMVGLWDGQTYRCLRTKEQLVHELALANQWSWDIVCHNAQFDIEVPAS